MTDMHKYSSDAQAEHAQLRLDRQRQLYKMIFQDIANIITLLVPGDKSFVIMSHAKSVMYSLIELKTGKRVKRF